MAVKTAEQLKADYPQSDPQDFVEDLVDSTMAAASATVPGNVELATAAEAAAGTDTSRAVTPEGLAAALAAGVPAASDTVAGKVELATNVEAQAVTDQTRAVTPYALGAALAALSIIAFQGSNLAGPCVAVGLRVGDVIFALTGAQAGVVGDLTSKFETSITVDDQIQQTAEENLAGNTYMALVYRQVDPA